ncbi:transposase family protein [Acinetobacter pollinis]|uniref:transposase family protein n=1 Tax=Acinetobacter pollinis TaxID=2605270 RepID=UPI0018C2E5DA|nr:transposase family protein [Acinetobacter pollinis]MBF7701845.1 transposase family protein [Acinetobacter pollinis]
MNKCRCKYPPSKGRPPKLCLEDQVLLCLSYWREYRTLFHVATILWRIRTNNI